MNSFDHYRDLMLDHVYGLLDTEQVAELEHYLATSPGADALRAQAEQWKARISSAAKAEFPGVQFAAPAAGRTSPARRRKAGKPKARSWAPWAIAASVVIILGGFGIPLMQHASEEREAARLTRARLAEFGKADAEHRTFVAAYNAKEEVVAREDQLASDQYTDLMTRREKALTDARKAVDDKQFIVRLSGPEHAQPGAPNEWRVEMFKRNGLQSLPGKVEWSVKDKSGAVVYSETKLATSKTGFTEPPTIKLPVSFWSNVKADSALTLEVVAYENNLKSNVNARVPLARPVFVTHLATDKPLYKQGEVVFFRSLTLDRSTFLPPEKDMMIEFRITRPGGQPEPIMVDGLPLRGNARGFMDAAHPASNVLGPDKKPIRGIGSGLFEIPAAAPGGEYALSVVDVTPSYDEVRKNIMPRGIVLETRKFNVIEYKPENILKTLEFDGKSYGGGDTVMVKCTATPVQGGKRKLNVGVSATVDGKAINVPNPGHTDADGVVRLKFDLPKNITRGQGTLDVTFSDGGDAEVISRPLPLIGRVINVEFFPEGGDLVEGVANRVYFQATTPSGKPADFKGYITDGKQTVAEVATLTDPDHPGVNRGQGMFTFTPKAGARYFLKIQKPANMIEPTLKGGLSAVAVTRGIGLSNVAIGAGSLVSSIPTGFELPKAKPDGVVLMALDAVTGPEQPIRVRLTNGQGRKSLLVGAYARGNLVDHQRVDVEAGKNSEVSLKVGNAAGGVTRITVFEEKNPGDGKLVQTIPVAERLVYHKPAQQLILNVQPDKTRYNPGSRVSLDLQSINEEERPTPAVLMVAVVNQNVLTMADEKTGRLMPTHFLLASEVKKPEDLEHADFLLGDQPQAAVALDLLLGTQGWRRFAEQTPASPKPAFKEEIDRLMVSNGQRSQAPVETLRQELDKVYTEFNPKIESSLARLAAAEEARVAVETNVAEVRAEAKALELDRRAALVAYKDAAAELKKFEEYGAERRSMLLVRLCVGLLLIAGLCIGIGAVRQSAGVPYFATAAGCFAICAIALFGMSVDSSNTGRTELAMAGAKINLPGGYIEFDQPIVDSKANGLPENGRDFFDAQGDNKNGRRLNELGRPADDAGKMMMRAGAVPVMAPVAPAAMMLNAPAAERGPVGGGFGAGGGMKAEQMRDAVAADKRKVLGDGMKFEKEMAEQRQFKGGEMLHKQRLDAQLFNRGRMAGAEKFARMQNLRQREMQRAEAGKGQLANEPQAAMAKPGVALGEGAFQMQQQQMYEMLMAQSEQAPGFFVREYKFQKFPRNGQPETRDDFTETVYWHPVLVVPESGRADVQFQLSDSIARYQVLVAGHTLDGRIGAVTTSIEARKPFTVDPKVPIEITATDRVDVPVRVVNDSDMRRRVGFTVTPNGLATEQTNLRDFIELGPNEKGRKLISFRATKKEGEASLTVVGTSDPIETPDNIVRVFRVVPDGFPATGAVSDLLEKQANATITLPELIPGTLKFKVEVYPTSLADLQNGLESLMREPGGCFEQTSTSNYPNLLILDYLKSADQVKPELARRAKEMLDRGYSKLVAFECPDTGDKTKHGFEWFGQADQQHQALTAYGLLQFKDLARAYPGKVDPELIKRTQQYLLGQQTPNKDGFKRNARALDSFGRAPDHITNAYIVWALCESDPDDKEGMTDLVKQLDTLKKQAIDHPEGKKDPYFLALVANGLLHRPANGNREAALAILNRIAGTHLKNGCVEGATTSITRSGGRDLQIETTALAVMGWLRSGEPTMFIKPVKETTKWIGQQRGGYGGFGSTQSTILALKALIEHTKASRKPAEAGEVRLTINGQTFKKAFTEKDQEVITLDIPDAEKVLKAGANEAFVELTAKQAYPFAITWSGNTTTPLSSDKRSVDVAASLDRETATEGETVRASVKLTNKTDAGHGMAIAIVGLPGGCRLPADLKELTKLREEGTISYFEVRGRELVLYWRALKPNQEIDLSFGMICEVPGQYAGPASRGYLYYNADHKHWVKPLSLTITPANQQPEAEVASK